MERYALDQPGYLYGVKHPTFRGFTKIGKALSPKRRLANYQTGDPLRRYEMAFAIRVTDYHRAERAAHRILDGFRVRETEWFRINYIEAFNLISKLGEPDARYLLPKLG